MDEPFIMLSTGLVELMSRDSLRFVLGHEVGHVLSGHAVYRTIMLRLINLQMSLSWTPVSALGIRAIIAALREWYRKAELSCDRAGLLCGQDPTAGVAGADPARGRDRPGADRHPVVPAAGGRVRSVEDIRDSFLKLRSVETQTHPFAVVPRRAAAEVGGHGGVPRDPGGGLHPPRRRVADVGLEGRPEVGGEVVQGLVERVDRPADEGVQRCRRGRFRGGRQGLEQVRRQRQCDTGSSGPDSGSAGKDSGSTS